MDNLFGKEDSGNESENVEVDSKQSPPRTAGPQECMDIEDPSVKVEFDAMSPHSQSDSEELNTPDLGNSALTDDQMEFKDDFERRDDHDDIFGSDITLPCSTPYDISKRRESKEKSKKELEEEEREKMQVLVSNFTEDQLDRYEMYRRAAFPKAAIKRIMQTITGCSVSQNVVIAMSGIAKVFVGEVVEEALDVMESNEESGPLQPKHLREAVRRLRLHGKVPNDESIISVKPGAIV